jgi:hypothetical protein
VVRPVKLKEAEQMRERLRGAYLLLHPHRGMVYVLTDGTYMSVKEYKDLRIKSLMFLFRGRG